VAVTTAHSASASRRYSACTASTSGQDSISNSVDFLSRLRPLHHG
jgi:hypothetical protein